MFPVLALIFMLSHVDFDIKLRDGTGQVKVHEIKEKEETYKKEGGGEKKRQEMSAMSLWMQN